MPKEERDTAVNSAQMLTECYLQEYPLKRCGSGMNPWNLEKPEGVDTIEIDRNGHLWKRYRDYEYILVSCADTCSSKRRIFGTLGLSTQKRSLFVNNWRL
jgi:hypothetical protein